MVMISELPEDLLLKILSSLNFKEVVATSILSRRWRSLWKLMTKLKIGNRECSPTCVDWVSSSLAFTNPQVLKSLDFKRIPGDFDRMINSWVEPAVYFGLRELRIELLYTSLELPISLYACGTLETLILCRLHLVDVPPWVCLSSLKTLGLLSVKFSSDESVQKLLSICPVLEDLVVIRSRYVNVEIFTINVPSLKSLTISYLQVASQLAGVHGFVINAPFLRYLNIRDYCSKSESLIGSLASVPHLSLCSKISNIPYHADSLVFFLEHLELCTCSAEWWKLLSRILEDAPKLRVLKLNSTHCAHYNDPTDRWNQLSSVPECVSSHLEILEWRQYKGTKPEKQVAKYIQSNASHLKIATFSSKSTEKHQMFKKLEYVPMCSKACQLLLE